MATKLKYNGYKIAFDDKKVNLTDMWKAADGNPIKKPSQWLQNDGTTELIETLWKQLKGAKKHLLEIRRGRYGGTFGHWQIALAYG